MQKLRPWEVDVLTYPNVAHMTFGASSPKVSFFMSRALDIHFYCKRPSEPHCTHPLANERNRHISSQR
jgi:hypothetical protein